MAGLTTRAADIPVVQARPPLARSSSFPDNRVAFRLQTPADRGIGVRIGIFKQPESRPYKLVAEERAGNFAKARGAFSHYCHMQQKSKMLIPTLPTHSRIHDMNQIWNDAKEQDVHRTLALETLDRRELSRKARLCQAKALLQTKTLAREVNQKLQASCSLPDLNAEPCGEQTAILQLLNRRVDVNRLKKCRLEAAYQEKANTIKQAVVETPELKALLDDIDHFENCHFPDLQIETVVDWKESSMMSWNPDSSQRDMGRLEDCQHALVQA